MDKNQEAVEMILNYVINDPVEAFGAGISPEERGKEAYKRIAPLMQREFSEEETREICASVMDSVDWDRISQCLKRLWEDQESKGHYTPEELKAQERLGLFFIERPHKPTGTCPKCGGSGKVKDDKGRLCNCKPRPVISPYEDEEDTCSRCDKPIEWCPACNGTGECQHKNMVESLPGMLYCRDCQQYPNERRSGEDRRGSGKNRRIGMGERRGMNTGRRRTLSNRRKAG